MTAPDDRRAEGPEGLNRPPDGSAPDDRRAEGPEGPDRLPAEAFIAAQTAIGTAPVVPEIRLHLASEITPIWQASEAFLAQAGIAPPFWAFAWPGGPSSTCRLNAVLNGVALETPPGDVVGSPNRWDLILAGDVCYEAPMTAHILPWLRAMAAAGADVLLADPGRAYLPRDGLEPLARYPIPTSLELEDRTERLVTIARLLP